MSNFTFRRLDHVEELELFLDEILGGLPGHKKKHGISLALIGF